MVSQHGPLRLVVSASRAAPIPGARSAQPGTPIKPALRVRRTSDREPG